MGSAADRRTGGGASNDGLADVSDMSFAELHANGEKALDRSLRRIAQEVLNPVEPLAAFQSFASDE